MELHSGADEPTDTGATLSRPLQIGVAVGLLLSFVFTLTAVAGGAAVPWASLSNSNLEVDVGLLKMETKYSTLQGPTATMSNLDSTASHNLINVQCIVNLGNDGCTFCTAVGKFVAALTGGAVALLFLAAVFAFLPLAGHTTMGGLLPFGLSIASLVMLLLSLILFQVGCFGLLEEFQSDSKNFKLGAGAILVIVALLLVAASLVPYCMVRCSSSYKRDEEDKINNFFCHSWIGLALNVVLVIAFLVGVIVPILSFITISACSVAPVSLPDNGVANVALLDNYAFGAARNAGLHIRHMVTNATTSYAPSSFGLDSVHNLHIDTANNLLFLIDVSSNLFALASIGTANRTNVTLLGTHTVAMSPTSAISGSSNSLVISGGTQMVSYYSYSNDGRTVTLQGQNGFARGGPAGEIASDGRHFALSTHIRDDRYGVSVLTLPSSAVTPRRPIVNQLVQLKPAGCTPGYSQPSNWPIQSSWSSGNSHLYAVYGGGLSVFSVSFSNFFAPLTAIASLSFSGLSPVDIAITATRAYIVGGPSPSTANNVYEVDINTPASPSVLRSWKVNGNAVGVATDGTNLVVASGLAVEVTVIKL